MTTRRPLVDEKTGEPLRMYARVRDIDGHEWVRKRTMWVCTAPVGLRYFSKKHRRMEEITRVGRLPWSQLQYESGPVEIVDLNDRSASARGGDERG